MFEGECALVLPFAGLLRPCVLEIDDRAFLDEFELLDFDLFFLDDLGKLASVGAEN